LRLAKVIVAALFLIVSIRPVLADTTGSTAPKLLPDRAGKFRKLSSGPVKPEGKGGPFGSMEIVAEEGQFLGEKGARVSVQILQFRQDVEAYQFLSLLAARLRAREPEVEIRADYGTAGFSSTEETAFVKGANFVRISGADLTNRGSFAQELSQTLDKGEGDIPVLIKHLPNAEVAQKTAIYLHSFNDLYVLGLDQPVINAITPNRNADAVIADYGPSRVLIVEFNTPQLASENDQQIIARIHEQWRLGQPAPTAYRRVGNYSVFVFDAPDEQTAKQLIDQVKYEQVVQWLGDNPNILKEAERQYVNTTLGVLVAVLKASGYALVLCLGMGGLIGGLLFTYRRAQQKDVTAFSDAGGMLRLNLDELTAETDPARLLRERN
jgi:hypothetical protein